MPGYYSHNAVYEEIEKRHCSNFLWAVGNSWVLLYGDNGAVPKLVVFVEGSSIGELDDDRKDRLCKTRMLAQELAKRAGLPFGTIEFDDRTDQISKVFLNGASVEMDALRTWFSRFDLPVKAGGAALKAINDASSSACHKWQRSALGRITVSDLDLIRIDVENGAPTSLYELKRSFIPLDRWSPYAKDYPNFNLTSDFASMAKVNFSIVYNFRRKSPSFFDDASRLSIFSYSRQAGPKRRGLISLDDFIGQGPRS